MRCAVSSRLAYAVDTAKLLRFSPPCRWVLTAAATVQRRRLKRVLFVGVTGSCGKTTTKELVAAVLASRGRGGRTAGSRNRFFGIGGRILHTRPDDDFSVMELASKGPGTLRPLVRLARPRIGVVTNVGGDHYKAFRTLEATAAEKRTLIEGLPPDGVAVLNADDPHVLAMRDAFQGRVITFGRSSSASLRAQDIRSAWPERLSFTVVHDGGSTEVRTRLCGKQWVEGVLAALAVGLAVGIPLADAAAAIERVEPAVGRMQPVELPGGITFIRDDWKAPLWSIPASLEFMRDARAMRKIVVMGTISDYGGDAGRKYVGTARRALEVADTVVFVGPNAPLARRAGGGDALLILPTVRQAAEVLADLLVPGDLVLLKGSNTADHLGRIVLARSARVACWRTRCGRKSMCDDCGLLGVPADGDGFRTLRKGGTAADRRTA